MSEKKYEFTGKRNVVDGTNLHQIRLLRDLPESGLKSGTIGGWIESEESLSQEGACWAFPNVEILHSSKVSGNIILLGESVITDNTFIFGNGFVKNSIIRSSSLKGRKLEIELSIIEGVEKKYSFSGLFFIRSSEIKNMNIKTKQRVEIENSKILTENKNGIVVHSPFFAYGSKLKIENGFFEDQTRIYKSYIPRLELIHISSPLRMSGVLFTGNTQIKTVGNDRNLSNFIMNEQVDDCVRSEHYLNLILSGSVIKGDIFLKGNWKIVNSEILGFSKLNSDLTSENLLNEVTVRDMVEIISVHEPFIAEKIVLGGDERISI